jgi:hypothetical protein
MGASGSAIQNRERGRRSVELRFAHFFFFRTRLIQARSAICKIWKMGARNNSNPNPNPTVT